MASILSQGAIELKISDDNGLHIVESSTDPSKQTIKFLNAQGLDDGTPIRLHEPMTIEELDAYIEVLVFAREKAKAELGKTDTLTLTVT
ncbi:MAG: hypothetical protein AAF740_03285 [Bacteroidota bacterium]